MTHRRDRLPVVAACAVWILCGAYASRFVDRGWIPHDEGTIAQSAERVLSGELPHRDFDDVYTGGLTYLNAAGMRLFGVNLVAPRLVLYVFFMAFLAAVFGVAWRVAPPWVAIGTMPLVAVWSVPNYFVSLPSWYNLFCATFGVLALMRFLETEHRRWLVLAGACGGLSILAKIAGVYYVAAGLLFLAHVEQSASRERATGQSRSRWFWLVVAAPIAVFLALLLKLLLSTPVAGAFLPMFVGPLAVCVFLVWREWSDGVGSVRDRTGRLLALILPFVAGAAVPLAAFVLLYWRHDALADLVRGVWVLPQRRLIEASISPPAVASLALGAPLAALLLARSGRAGGVEWLVAAAIGVLLGSTLVASSNPVVYRAVWAAARSLTIVAVLALVWLATRPASAGNSPRVRARLFLLAAMAAMVALVQFPYATPIYFCYAAPMTVLALAAVVSARPRAPGRAPLLVAVFFFLFAVVFVNRSYGWNLGVQFIPYAPDSRLDLERGGLLVTAEDKRTYEEIVRLLEQHAGGGAIFAGPDCPEAYFLSGLRNPTRVFFDFLTPEIEDAAWMVRLVDQAPIRAVVVNTAPIVSPPLDSGALAVLERRFPVSQRVAKFDVRWQE